MFEKDRRERSHDLIDRVFKCLLPAHGMGERPAQTALAHQALDAMLNGTIALCDAGTGIGKTFAYLTAGTAFLRYRAEAGLSVQPITISTSSVALQRAVCDEYLPLLSDVLLEDGQIKEPLRAVIRKGKTRYVCDDRLEKRLRRVILRRKNAGAAEALLSLRNRLDIDGVNRLSRYDRERVCVPTVCGCGRQSCRYREFLDECARNTCAFQICNHNLLLADANRRAQGQRPILRDYPVLIVDEAHKLPEAA